MRKCCLLMVAMFGIVASASTDFNASKYRQDFMAISTVQLISTVSTGTYFGTGFFYLVPHPTDPRRRQIVIMTNKHVLDGKDNLILMCPVSDNGKPAPGNYETFTIPQPYSIAYKHPSNDVDLCAIPMTEKLDSAKARGRNILYAPYTSNLLADDKCYDDLRQLDTAVMIGYPSALNDNKNLQPIFRTGSFATNPSLDFQGRCEFVLDIPNYGGSSGSPVVLFDEGKHWKHEGFNNATMVMGSRFKLLGVNYACYTAKSDGVVTLPTTPNPIILPVESRIPNNTAFVIKASRIKELEALIQGVR